MADLRQVCIEGFCSEVPEYTAGSNIAITGTDPRIISADLSDFYNKTEIDGIVSAIEVGGFKEVDELPQTGEPNYIYLVPNAGGGYERYIYSDGQWIDLGDTDTVYSAGTNIEITDANVINSLIQSGTNITVTNDGKVNLIASPAFTGTPTAPTAAAGTNTTQIATTAMVQAAIAAKVPSSVPIYATQSNISVASGSEVVHSFGINTNRAGLLMGYLYVNWSGRSGGYRMAHLRVGSINHSGQKWDCATAASTLMKIPIFSATTQGQAISAVFQQNTGSALTVTTTSFYGAVFG